MRIIGYETNALYLSTMLRNMPCGKERVIHYENWPGVASTFIERLKAGIWFGCAEVYVEIPEPLWMKSEEMPPFFLTTQIPAEAGPQYMMDYLQRTGRKRGDGEKLTSARACSTQKLLLYAPLSPWYAEHGAVIKDVHRAIGHQATKIFTWFVEQVTEVQRTGDVDKSETLLAELFKLLGNSAYGKLIEALERQTCVHLIFVIYILCYFYFGLFSLFEL